MNTEIIKKVQNKYMDKKLPAVKVGDTVEVDTIIREGSKQRIQKFKGLVISMTGSGTQTMVTVRKISYGVGVEKKLPLYSPNVAKIKVIKTEPVRRSKLYFMRDRVGKSAMRVRKGRTVMVPEEGQVPTEEVIAEVVPAEVEVAAEEAQTPVAE